MSKKQSPFRSAADQTALLAKNDAMAQDALRVICVAYKTNPGGRKAAMERAALYPAGKGRTQGRPNTSSPGASMIIRTMPMGPLETNCYVLEEDGGAVIVDPGGNPAFALNHLEKNNLKLTAILNTHLHFDHILGNAELATATGATIYAGNKDEDLLDLTSGTRFGLPPTPSFSFTNLDPGEITLLGQTCRVLATPGHSRGSLSYYFPEAHAVFAGDVLFRLSIGRSDLPGGDEATLGGSIRTILYALPPDTTVYPGHGPCTTIGNEMRENPYYRG